MKYLNKPVSPFSSLWRTAAYASVQTMVLTLLSGCTAFTRWNLDTKDERSVDSRMALARLCENHASTDRAAAIYQDVVEKQPDNVEGRRRLGIMAARRGSFDEAEKHFEAALAVEPENAAILNDYGYACFLEDRLEQAERLLLSATKLDSQLQSAWSNLALIYGQQNRFDECRKAFQRACDDAASLHCNMGYVFSQNNRLEDAAKEFKEALLANPECKAAGEGLLQVSALLPGQEPKTIITTFARSKSKTSETKSEANDEQEFYTVDSTPGTMPLGGDAVK